jgi:hypothetical protein
MDYENPIAYAELHFISVGYYYMIEKYGMRPECYLKVLRYFLQITKEFLF